VFVLFVLFVGGMRAGAGSGAGQARMDGTATAAPSCKVEDGTRTITMLNKDDTTTTTTTTTLAANTTPEGASATQEAASKDVTRTTGVLQPNVLTWMGPPRVFTGAVGRCVHRIPTCRVAEFPLLAFRDPFCRLVWLGFQGLICSDTFGVPRCTPRIRFPVDVLRLYS
jgi:hypothetical protein